MTGGKGRRIAVTGGRDFNDAELVRRTLSAIRFSKDDVLVHGACRGADTLAAEVASRIGTQEPHPADWKKYGRAAGPIRNREMLSSGVDMLIAFPGGAGTRNCVMIAEELGIPVMRAEEIGG